MQLQFAVQFQFLRVQSYFMAEIPWYHWPEILRNCSFDSYAYKCTIICWFLVGLVLYWHYPHYLPLLRAVLCGLHATPAKYTDT